MKNLIYGVVIAGCIIVAVVVFLVTRSGGGSSMGSVDDSSMIWVKCRACNQSYEMNEKQYYQELSEAAKAGTAAMMFTPPLKCQKCGKMMLSKATKCANASCGEVFFEGSVPNDYPDRCPKCKHSYIEDSRNARKA